MKITIELEQSDMTDVAAAALVAFLQSVPAKAVKKRKPAGSTTATTATTPVVEPVAPPAALPVGVPEAVETPAAAPQAATGLPELQEQARGALRQFAAANGREAAFQKLHEHGKSVNDLTGVQLQGLIEGLAA